jgi:hypothetical protein
MRATVVLGGFLRQERFVQDCGLLREAVIVAHHRRVGELDPQRLELDAVGDGLKVAQEADDRHQRDQLVIVVVLGRVRPGVIGYTTGGVADTSALLGELSGPL